MYNNVNITIKILIGYRKVTLSLLSYGISKQIKFVILRIKIKN